MQQYQYDVPEYCYVFVSRWLTDSRVFVSKTGVATLLPLYLHPPEGTIDHEGRTPNLDEGFIAAVAGAGNLNWDAAADDWAVCGDRFGPQSTLGFIYAQLHAPSYREQFAEELRTSFPRVMLPGSRALFAELARLGGELAALHLMESGTLENVTPAYSGPGRPEVARVWWSDGTVWLDAPSTKARDGHRATKPGTMGFANVPEEVWDFYIGGYQVCYKWLKDRKGRRLSGDDLSDYQKIVAALGETIRIMSDIDDVIEEHGGWASAFATGEVSRK